MDLFVPIRHPFLLNGNVLDRLQIKYVDHNDKLMFQLKLDRFLQLTNRVLLLQLRKLLMDPYHQLEYQEFLLQQLFELKF